VHQTLLSLLGLLLGAGSACLAPAAAQPQNDASRRAFLETVDGALDSRDPLRIAALSDAERWRASGRGELRVTSLWLPPGRLTRVKELSPNEVLYEDANASTWRLRMRRGEDGRWLIVIVAQPCPTRTLPRGPVGRDLPDPPESTPSESAPSEQWTPVECWPLPR
jgi:hypothetical protein